MDNKKLLEKRILEIGENLTFGDGRDTVNDLLSSEKIEDLLIMSDDDLYEIISEMKDGYYYCLDY